MELEVSAIDPKTIYGGGPAGEGSWIFFKGWGRVEAGGGLQGVLPAGQGATAFVEQILAVVYVPMILQRQVPAVQVVHVLEGAARHQFIDRGGDVPVVQQRR